MPADPKPRKRIRDPAAIHAKVVSELRCRCCQKPARTYTLDGKLYVMGLTGHHTIPRSQRGDDVALNIGPTCGHGTAGCHGRLEARDRVFRRLYRLAMPPEEEEYVVRVKGWYWLERHYPRELAHRAGPVKPLVPRLAEWYAIDRMGWPPAE